MQTRSDLRIVAERLAAQARLAIDPPRPRDWPDDTPSPVTADHEQAARLVLSVESALRAATLVDPDPGPLTAAIERFNGRLNATGIEATLEAEGPDAALDEVGDLLEAAVARLRVANAVQDGYRALRDLLDGLARDFDAADTPTAQRIAARIHTGLENAAEAIEAAKTTRED